MDNNTKLILDVAGPILIFFTALILVRISLDVREIAVYIKKEKKHLQESPEDGNTGLSNKVGNTEGTTQITDDNAGLSTKEGHTEGTTQIKIYLYVLYEVKAVSECLHKPLENLLSDITGKSVEIRYSADGCQLKLTGLIAPDRAGDYTEDVVNKAAGRTILILCNKDCKWKLDNALFIRYTEDYSECELMSTKTVENETVLQALNENIKNCVLDSDSCV